MNNPTNFADVLAELRRPFAPDEIKFRPSGGGAVAYVETATVLQRLDEACPGWSSHYREVSGGIECTLIIDGHARADIGVNESQGEMGAKGAYSDALKRAAHQFGAARNLRYWKGPSKYSGQIGGELAAQLRAQYEDWCNQQAQLDRFGAIYGAAAPAGDDITFVPDEEIPTVAQLRGRAQRAVTDGAMEPGDVKAIVEAAGGDFEFPAEWTPDVRRALASEINTRLNRKMGERYGK